MNVCNGIGYMVKNNKKYSYGVVHEKGCLKSDTVFDRAEEKIIKEDEPAPYTFELWVPFLLFRDHLREIP